MGKFKKKELVVKKTRNRKKIKTAEIKMLIEPKYKIAIKRYCEENNITMTSFITKAIIESLKKRDIEI